MKEKTQIMTEGSPWKLILGLALPLMFGNIFQQLYTVMDTLIVGQVLGVHALAALGASDWLNWMILGLITGITQGFSILAAQKFGAGRAEELRETVGASITLSALCAIVIELLSQAILLPLLKLLDTPTDILPLAQTYLRILFAGIPIVMAYNLLASLLRALGDGRTPLCAMIVASVLNILLDILFVAGLHTGVGGAAAATLIAQAIAALYCLLVILRMELLHIRPNHLRPDCKLVWQLFSLGTPMAAQNTIIAVGGLVIQSIINGFGVIFIAGYTASNKLYGILEVAATSYGYAMVTYVGQNLGAGLLKRIRLGVRHALGIALATSLAIAAIMLLTGRTLVGSFITGNPDEVLAATDIAYHYLAIMSLFLPILYLLHLYRSSLQGMGDTVLPMASGIAEFVMRTGAALTLPSLLGPEGIFYAEILAWAGADLILVTAYYARIHALTRRLADNTSAFSHEKSGTQ
ncbi:MAG: MATE family efflux transporter [bacterium]|nr:MATE family efflux transporter [bacterium]MCM1373875.1 MATE family efflux transporter [Muribaculum sp.]